jgi:hypothetical protein
MTSGKTLLKGGHVHSDIYIPVNSLDHATAGGKKTDLWWKRRLEVGCRYIDRSILLIVATEMGKKEMSGWKEILNGVHHSDNIHRLFDRSMPLISPTEEGKKRDHVRHSDILFNYCHQS